MNESFPQAGKSRDDVLSALKQTRTRDLKSDGRAFAFVYDPGEEAREVARQAFAACMPINGLDPTVYPSARELENGVVKACLELMHAPEGALGTATAGGTESVMLAVKTARDFARKNSPELKTPKMLLPITAHACFHKAAHYFGVEVVNVDVNPETGLRSGPGCPGRPEIFVRGTAPRRSCSPYGYYSDWRADGNRSAVLRRLAEVRARHDR